MDFSEFNQRIDQLQEFITNELPVFAEQVAANDLIALITSRVVQKGVNYKGKRFKPYSDKTVAAWRFWGKSRTQTAEKKVRALSRVKGSLSYKKFRALNNLNTDKKNFEFTGEMWRKFAVVKVKGTATGVKVTIGGKTSAAQLKIDENSSREGYSIIRNSDDEEKTVQGTTSDWLIRNAERILKQ